MTIEVLKSNIQSVKITKSELHYMGNITIEKDLSDPDKKNRII